MGENNSVGGISSVAYLGLPIGCTWCAYDVPRDEGPGRGRIPSIPLAMWVVATPKGPREVCDAHAKLRSWSPRDHRVGAVA